MRTLREPASSRSTATGILFLRLISHGSQSRRPDASVLTMNAPGKQRSFIRSAGTGSRTAVSLAPLPVLSDRTPFSVEFIAKGGPHMYTKALLLVAGMTVAGAASALEPPKVEYSADSNLETADEQMSGHVYSAPNKERREFVQDGEKAVLITRHDKKIAWMVMPADKMYIEMKLGKGGGKGDVSGYKIVEQQAVGQETVNGVKTTKYKLVMHGPKGSKMGGFFWQSKDGITVKMDAISVEKSGKERFMSELKNLQVGKQDAKLFELPAGYEKMGMPDVGAMMGRGDKADAKQPASKGGEEKGGFGLKDALKLLK